MSLSLPSRLYTCLRRPVLSALSLLTLLVVTSGCATVDVASLLQPKLAEHTVVEADSWTRNKIALIDLGGVISNSDGGLLSGGDRVTPERIKAALARAEADSRVKAVVLRIDSPGGDATASDLIQHEIAAFRARTGRPVLASIQGMGCSGGYYAACGADQIAIAPTGITGSIGVIARFPQLTRLADKVGYDEVIIKSGPMKDMGNPLAEMSPDTRAVLQATIDSMYGRFLDVVVAARPAFASRDALRPVADGRIYTADQALANGLVDKVAYLDEVLADAKAAAGIRDARVVSYLYGDGTDANVYSRTGVGGGAGGVGGLGRALRGAPLVNLDLTQLFGAGHGGFYYLWMPTAGDGVAE